MADKTDMYSCHSCRCPLFRTGDVIEHNRDEKKGRTHFKSKQRNACAPLSECTSIFTEPLEWVTSRCDSDRILCPKCGCRVGCWKWEGLQCSCGHWVTPAFQFLKSKVDHPIPVAVISVASPLPIPPSASPCPSPSPSPLPSESSSSSSPSSSSSSEAKE